MQKGIKESTYIVDGEKYTKFGTTTPEAVSNALNIKELTLNGNKEQLNFWNQMDYPFLLDKTAVELFRFIIDSGDNDRISTVLKSMVSDRQTLTKSINILQGEINVLDGDIDRIENNLKELEDKNKEAMNLVNLQPKVSRYNILKQIKSKLDNINTQKSDVEGKFNIVSSNLSSIKSNAVNIISIFGNKNTLDSIFIKLHKIISDTSDISEDLNRLKVIKGANDITYNKLNGYMSIKNTIDNIKLKLSEIKLIKLPEVNLDSIKLNSLVLCKNNINDIKDKLVCIDSNESSCKKTIDLYSELLGLFKVCPLCGSELHF